MNATSADLHALSAWALDVNEDYDAAAVAPDLAGPSVLLCAADLVMLAVADVADNEPGAFDAARKVLDDALAYLDATEMEIGMMRAGFCTCGEDCGVDADGNCKPCRMCDCCWSCGQLVDCCDCPETEEEDR